jgi:FKBP-type peptidyl-prolyl cis-trans isomerase
MKKWSPLLCLVVLVGCTRSKDLKTDKDKYSYAIGYQFAKNLQAQSVDVDADSLAQAITDVSSNKKSALNEEQMQAALQKMYEGRKDKVAAEAEGNKKKAQAFLEANKTKEGVKTTETGLQYKVVTEGKGPSPKKTDKVVVNYRGTLIDGTEFDSSYKRNKPAEFPVEAVIPGWTEALQKMKKGAKWQLFIPPELAYGEHGRPSIPPNSVLVFDVELMDIKN